MTRIRNSNLVLVLLLSLLSGIGSDVVLTPGYFRAYSELLY